MKHCSNLSLSANNHDINDDLPLETIKYLLESIKELKSKPKLRLGKTKYSKKKALSNSFLKRKKRNARTYKRVTRILKKASRLLINENKINNIQRVLSDSGLLLTNILLS